MRKILLLMALLANSAAIAQDSRCSEIVNRYNSTISDISTTLRRYTQCVSGSQATDDCSLEFRRLRNAQGDFESVVSEHQASCR